MKKILIPLLLTISFCGFKVGIDENKILPNIKKTFTITNYTGANHNFTVSKDYYLKFRASTDKLFGINECVVPSRATGIIFITIPTINLQNTSNFF